MSRFLFKLLARVGLTTIKRQGLAEKRADDMAAYAELVTAKAEESGDMIIAGDYTAVHNTVFKAGRRLVVPPWVKYTIIAGCYFEGDEP